MDEILNLIESVSEGFPSYSVIISMTNTSGLILYHLAKARQDVDVSYILAVRQLLYRYCCTANNIPNAI